VLWKFRAPQCSMPKDTIYPILGMTEDAQLVSNVYHLLHWSKAYTSVVRLLLHKHSFSDIERSHVLWVAVTRCSLLSFLVPNWNVMKSPNRLFLQMDTRGRKRGDDRKLEIYFKYNILRFNSSYATNINILGNPGQSLVCSYFALEPGSYQQSIHQASDYEGL
jgi:hypothetical protein